MTAFQQMSLKTFDTVNPTRYLKKNLAFLTERRTTLGYIINGREKGVTRARNLMGPFN